jgi:hypothetical protein
MRRIVVGSHGSADRRVLLMLRLALVVVVAVVMAVVGYQLLCREGSERWALDRQSFYFVWPSSCSGWCWRRSCPDMGM